MARIFIIDKELEFDRQELIEFLADYIEENNITERQVPALGCSTTIDKALKNHAVLIAKQLGFEVIGVDR